MAKNAKMDIVWISARTGELQETLGGAIKTAIENLIYRRFIDIIWTPEYYDGKKWCRLK